MTKQNTCIPCATPKKTFYGHYYNKKQISQCPFGHSIIGPQDCDKCNEIRTIFNTIMDSPARPDKPGQEWYFCGHGIRYYGNEKTDGWVNKFDKKTHTESDFQREVQKGKLRTQFHEYGYLRTIRQIFTIFGFGFSFGEEWAWWSCYSPKSRMFYSPYQLRSGQEPPIHQCRPKKDGCGEKCDTIINMISKARYVNKQIIESHQKLLKREVKFLNASSIKHYNSTNYKDYLKAPHDKPIFQCKCPFHQQFALKQHTFKITPSYSITYYQ